MTLGLTQKQAEALRFIRGFIEERGYSPNYDEIKAGLGLGSKSAVHRRIHQLAARGAIEMRRRSWRSISVSERAA